MIVGFINILADDNKEPYIINFKSNSINATAEGDALIVQYLKDASVNSRSTVLRQQEFRNDPFFAIVLEKLFLTLQFSFSPWIPCSCDASCYRLINKATVRASMPSSRWISTRTILSGLGGMAGDKVWIFFIRWNNTVAPGPLRPRGLGPPLNLNLTKKRQYSPLDRISQPLLSQRGEPWLFFDRTPLFGEPPGAIETIHLQLFQYIIFICFFFFVCYDVVFFLTDGSSPAENRQARHAYASLFVLTLMDKRSLPTYQKFEHDVRQQARKYHPNDTVNINYHTAAFHDSVIMFAVNVNMTVSEGQNVSRQAIVELTQRFWGKAWEGQLFKFIVILMTRYNGYIYIHTTCGPHFGTKFEGAKFFICCTDWNDPTYRRQTKYSAFVVLSDKKTSACVYKTFYSNRWR